MCLQPSHSQKSCTWGRSLWKQTVVLQEIFDIPKQLCKGSFERLTTKHRFTCDRLFNHFTQLPAAMVQPVPRWQKECPKWRGVPTALPGRGEVGGLGVPLIHGLNFKSFRSIHYICFCDLKCRSFYCTSCMGPVWWYLIVRAINGGSKGISFEAGTTRLAKETNRVPSISMERQNLEHFHALKISSWNILKSLEILQ